MLICLPRAQLTQGRGPLAALPPAAPAGEAAAAGGAGAALVSQLSARVPTHWCRGRRGPGGALSGPGAPPPAQHAPGWEEAHVVLLERSFLPALAQSIAAMPRASRRLREAVFALPPAALLLRAVPAEEGQPPPLAQLTWRGAVVGHAALPPPREQQRKRRPDAQAAEKRWGSAPPRPQQQQGGAAAQEARRRGGAATAEDARRATG